MSPSHSVTSTARTRTPVVWLGALALVLITGPAPAWVDECAPNDSVAWPEENPNSARRFFTTGGDIGWWDGDTGNGTTLDTAPFRRWEDRYQYDFFGVHRLLTYGGRTLRALEAFSDGTGRDADGKQWGTAHGVKSQMESVEVSQLGPLTHSYTDTGGVSRTVQKVAEVFNNSFSMDLKFQGDSDRATVVFFQFYPDVYDSARRGYYWMPWALFQRQANGEIHMKCDEPWGGRWRVNGVSVPENQFFQVKVDVVFSTSERNQGLVRFTINPSGSPEVRRTVSKRNPDGSWGPPLDGAAINFFGPCGTTSATKAVKLPRGVKFVAGIYMFADTTRGTWPYSVQVDHDKIWIGTVR